MIFAIELYLKKIRLSWGVAKITKKLLMMSSE